MLAPARLDRGDLLRLAQIADVEDPDPAKPLDADRRRHALGAAVEAASRLLDRHEQQSAAHGHVALAAWTDDRCQEAWLVRTLDVVDVEPVVVAHKGAGPAEREVGI